MENIVIYGAGGFAREVAHLIEQINAVDQKWNILGFIDDDPNKTGIMVNDWPILGTFEWFNDNPNANVVLATGSPKGKQLIVNRLQAFSDLKFPNLFHPSLKMSRFNQLGIGNVICEGSILTTNITVGNFVTINLNCTIGHDVEIQDFATILPSSSVSGNVVIEEGVDLGTSSSIIPHKRIGSWTIVGAGSVVVKDLPENCTAVGIPAKPIKYHE
ncbi:acetyltransferase [Neobacillus rhizosphaerae]|uniref:acetyltransferase n=1 Tax=Neobacillus rhizosphaerae TaxID=2880965 RepID=UPI003D29F2F5